MEAGQTAADTPKTTHKTLPVASGDLVLLSNYQFRPVSFIKRLCAGMFFLASILVLSLTTVLFGKAIERQQNPNRNPTSLSTESKQMSISLHRNTNWHYVFGRTINQIAAEFIVDTGATPVPVPVPIADRARLRRERQQRVITANGITPAYTTRIDSLVVGDIEETDVAATIAPNLDGNQILLGMSFLKRLDFSQRDNSLILTQRFGRNQKPANAPRD